VVRSASTATGGRPDVLFFALMKKAATSRAVDSRDASQKNAT
jgi:hypothetical protein